MRRLVSWRLAHRLPLPLPIPIRILITLIAFAFAGAAAASPPAADNPSGGAIARHDLSASVDPASGRLTVTDTLLVLHGAGVPRATAFPVLLNRSLAVERVTGLGAGSSALVRFREDRLRPRDYWFRPPYGEMGGYDRARTVWIEPQETAGDWPESLRIVLSYAGVLYDSLRAPKAAYSRGFETTSGLVDPRGVFLSGGSFWVPSRPDERFLFRCALDTPAGWQAVSQGALAWGGENAGRYTNVWTSQQPMEEIYYIAGPYRLRAQPHGDVQVMTFTYAATDSATCQRYIDGTGRYLDLYGDRIGPYPFPKFALVENFWQTGFGMPSFTLLGDQVIRLPFILDTSYGHEILHNWWGNGVFVDYASGNWCEGLTTYGADYLYKERASAEEAREYRRSTLQGYSDYVSASEDFPLRAFREREDFATQAVGYGKSMMVFHQLRRLLGDEAFWAALQDFYRSHLFRRASWDDLFDSFSKRAGADLGAWKAQWLDRPGAPRLKIASHELRESKKGGWDVAITIEQDGGRAAPADGSPFAYDLLVPVAVGRGESEESARQIVRMQGMQAACTIHVTERPDWIAVDPDFDLLRHIDPAEIPPALSRTLGADTAIVVIASGLDPAAASAYRALAEDWAKGERLAILEEGSLPPGARPAVPTWFFGLG
ncbi:MAG: M1 family aminopeptidase, partial [Candidatus Eisenbacteria bacterium]|nr:M1 family aminopeptidase [Candidatus Eisenbacteria bacterium]